MNRLLEEGEESAGVVLKSGGHSLTIWCQESTYTGKCPDFAEYAPGDWVSYHFKKNDDGCDELVVNRLAPRLGTVKGNGGLFTAKARIAIQPFWFSEHQLVWSPEFNVVRHEEFTSCDLDILAHDRLYNATIKFDGQFKLVEIGDSCEGQTAMDILFAPWRIGELEQMQSGTSAMGIENRQWDKPINRAATYFGFIIMEKKPMEQDDGPSRYNQNQNYRAGGHNVFRGRGRGGFRGGYGGYNDYGGFNQHQRVTQKQYVWSLETGRFLVEFESQVFEVGDWVRFGIRDPKKGVSLASRLKPAPSILNTKQMSSGSFVTANVEVQIKVPVIEQGRPTFLVDNKVLGKIEVNVERLRRQVETRGRPLEDLIERNILIWTRPLEERENVSFDRVNDAYWFFTDLSANFIVDAEVPEGEDLIHNY